MGAIVLIVIFAILFLIVCPIVFAIDWRMNYKNKMTFKEYVSRI